MKVLIITNTFPTKKDPEWGTFVRDQIESLKPYIATIIVKQSRKAPSGFLTFAALGLWRTIIEEYDLIHAHYGFHSGIWPMICNRHPLVVTFHGSDAYIEPERNKLYKFLQRRLVAYANHIVAVSNDVREHLINKLGAEPKKISVIPCGIDTKKFCPRPKYEIRARLGIKRDIRLVLYIGRLSHAKGVHHLHEVSYELKNVDFFFIGEGPLKWDSPNCHFVGVLEHDCIPEWINAADVLVLPSYSEGTPVVVLEALASETPVICSDVGACHEIISDGITGLIIPPGNVQALINAIKTAIFEITFNTYLGRQKMKQDYDLNRVSEKLVTLYTSVLKEHKAKTYKRE